MNNPSTIFKSLLVFAICIPLAIIIGYLLATPLTYSSLGGIGIVAILLITPLLLRWHYPLLFLGWNMTLIIFFIKGQPNLWLVLVAMSLTISVFERALGMPIRFLQTPSITWPLMTLAIVVLVTAKLTGGFGLRSFGSHVYGGRKYIFLLVSIAGYFAFAARSIPIGRARLFIAFFFLGGITSCIGELFPISPGWLYTLFWFFPPTIPSDAPIELGVTRLGGVGAAAFAVYCWMMARYGIRGIFLSGLKWRLLGFLLILPLSLLGGFRSTFLTIALTFAIQFCVERLYRTRLLPLIGGGTALVAVLVLPFVSSLPYTFQRALAIFPLPIDAAARADAEYSSQWRINMWKSLLPQVPRHLWLGKGYAITPEDYEVMPTDTAFRAFDPSELGHAIAGDYHNGPLSIILPFGVWGLVSFLAFVFAAIRIVYYNFRYGDPQLKTINCFLLSYLAVRLIMFFFVVGALELDMATFAGLLGLSVALNNGVAQPIKKPVPVETEAIGRPRLRQSRLRPSFQR